MSRDQDVSAALLTIRERCKSLGLPSWRIDGQGTILDGATEPGLAGLWLNCSEVSAAVSNASQAWATSPAPVALFHGCWLIPLPERRRRRTVGYLVAMLLTREGLLDPRFREICSTTSLDVASTRKALCAFAKFEEEAVPALASTLAWMTDDLAKTREQQESISGFTNQLTESFETIDLLYSLGRGMGDMARPDQFVTSACDMLARTMRFGFVGVVMSADSELPEGLRGAMRFCGNAQTPDLLALLKEQERAAAESPRGIIVSEAPVLAGGGQTQVCIHRLMRGTSAVGFLVAGDKQGVDPQVSSYDTQLFEAAAGYMGAFLDNASLYAQQRALFMGTIEALAAAIEAKDRYTCGHAKRVAHLSERLARSIGLSEELCETIRISGLLHDVGKIGVPEAVLCKMGRLSDDEFAAIKLHPEMGYRILKDIAMLHDELPGVLHHHERWDGKGYPHGIAGEQIPLIARIMALADTFDAMSSTRSYRSAMPREKVLAEILRCGGTQFDPALAPEFVKLDFAEYDRMVVEHQAASGWKPEAPESVRLAA